MVLSHLYFALVRAALIGWWDRSWRFLPGACWSELNFVDVKDIVCTVERQLARSQHEGCGFECVYWIRPFCVGFASSSYYMLLLVFSVCFRFFRWTGYLPVGINTEKICSSVCISLVLWYTGILSSVIPNYSSMRAWIGLNFPKNLNGVYSFLKWMDGKVAVSLSFAQEEASSAY